MKPIGLRVLVAAFVRQTELHFDDIGYWFVVPGRVFAQRMMVGSNYSASILLASISTGV